MLNIIIGEENKPNDYIHDVEALTYEVGIPNTELSKYLLDKLENATYLDNTSFIDRDGFKLPVQFMSNGMKILIAVQYSGRCINGIELGDNAFELLIQSINGRVYFDNINRFELPELFDLGNISVNGVTFSTVLELENALWKN